MPRLRFRSGLRVEDIGSDVVVLDRSEATIHRLEGDLARAARAVGEGIEWDEVPQDLIAAMEELAAMGLVADTTRWTRRKLLAAGGAASAATIISFALPGTAHAATTCPGGMLGSANLQRTTAGPGTFYTGPGVTMLHVEVWGAGGGGSGGRSGVFGIASASGPGGGGGGYAAPTIDVTPCTSYSFVVGAAGTAGSGGTFSRGDGGTGGTSTFTSGTTTLLTATGGAGGIGGTANAAGGVGSFHASVVGAITNMGGGSVDKTTTRRAVAAVGRPAQLERVAQGASVFHRVESAAPATCQEATAGWALPPRQTTINRAPPLAAVAAADAARTTRVPQARREGSTSR